MGLVAAAVGAFGATGAAILGAGTIAAGAGLASSVIASNSQQKAEKSAINEQNKMYGNAQTALQPYEDFGQSKLSTLNNLLSPNSATAQSTLSGLPGYQFALNQGLQSTQSGAAARGLGTSGAAMRGAADYTTGLANQYYFDYANQLQNAVNTGANAAGGLASAALNTGSGVANSLTGIGNAQAAGAVGAGNAVSGAANNLQGLMFTNALLQNQGYGGLFGGNGGGIYGSGAATTGTPAAQYGYNVGMG